MCRCARNVSYILKWCAGPEGPAKLLHVYYSVSTLGLDQWYSTGGTRRHPKILFFVI
jgi:hypothetical protein